MLAAELMGWQSLCTSVFAALSLWECTLLTLSLVEMSHPRKEQSREHIAQVVLFFTGNGKSCLNPQKWVSIYPTSSEP